MSSNDFDLVPESVRAHHFPNADAWVESSRPALSAVTEAIEEEAGLMAGKLALELIDASAIVEDSSAWVHCRKILRMQVAARIARDMLGADAAISLAWDKAVAAFYVGLADGGASFLGDGATSTGTSNADGPHSHATVFGLERDIAANMSSTVPKLRMDDQQ